MYDMYHWDRFVPASEDAGHPHPARVPSGGRAAANGAGRAARTARRRVPAAHAVQVALDRRDNGGDSRTARDQ